MNLPFIAVTSPSPCRRVAVNSQVWALDVSERAGGVEMLSGSADSVMVRWRDCTEEVAEKGAAEAALRLEQEQELSNAVFAGQVTHVTHVTRA